MARRKRAAEELPAYYERVYVLDSAIRTLAEESEAKPGIETGGVLVGFADTDLNAVVVTAASGPGPNAHHGRNTFDRDRAYCQEFLDRHAAATDGIVDFVGEWHKHREPDPWPSSTDVRTYRTLAADPNCHLALPVVLITGVRTVSRMPVKEAYVHVNAFVFRQDGFVSRRVRLLQSEAYADLLVEGRID